jgi:hypothetical protein
VEECKPLPAVLEEARVYLAGHAVAELAGRTGAARQGLATLLHIIIVKHTKWQQTRGNTGV